MADVAFLPLVYNAALLLGMAVVYDVATSRWTALRGRAGQLLIGILVGTIGIVIMRTPWVLTPGIVFDTRSVLLAVAGLVFGPVPTLVAMAMTAALRLSDGGAAAGVGVAVIVESGLMGIAWRRIRRGAVEDIGIGELYLLGIAVHVVMLALMVTLPAGTAIRVLEAIALPVIVIYPVATALLGALMASRLKRERTAAALATSEERLRLAVSAADQGLYDVDLRTGAAVVNDEYAMMLGHDPAAFHESNSEWLGRLHPDDRERIEAAFRDYVAGRRPDYRVEFRQRTSSGDWAWILSVGEIVERDARGTPVRMLGTHTDITARREAEDQARQAEATMAGLLDEAASARRALLSMIEDLRSSDRELRETAERYQALVRYAPDAIFVNRDDRVVLVNEACLTLFGATDDSELLGRRTDDLFHPDDRGAGRDRVLRLRTQREPVPAREARIIRVDGSIVDVETSASPFEDQGGVSIHVILRDITERKRAQVALRELADALEVRVRDRTAELEEANRELEAFAYSVSHDLRAPLRAVSGFSDILARRHADRLDEDGRHFLDNIIAASRQMSELIDDLLAYARLGRDALLRGPVPLEPVVDRMCRTFESQLAEPGARLDVTRPLATPIGDQVLIEQVLLNFVSNALKYRRDGVPPQVRVDATQRDGMVALSVTDNGIGIPAEYHERIFDVFARLHTDEEYAGTGIGLAIAHKAARLMDGEVTVESTPGAGSTFSLHLPAAAADDGEGDDEGALRRPPPG
ncbi:MAG: PAS domain S-box protein [Chloroflexota bacterium]